ncbi:rhamnogalacturonan acetylesterase [Sphingomonas sp. JC676]|uniref:rhamnogalacturonan acetylesterase n=1 Tax=Sphingomonas sp. JC676 TaxID=2768065 RepID=UPI0016584CB3|nr:rhamnogalacturonan acetylesterase [Sphingomonas sp. JC676]MBC9033710.1 rhamnogalacturonan acetylesterase [Sphingomonas sp. JC676]
MISLVLALLLGQAGQDAKPQRTDAPPLVADRIILVGDSTMAPSSGWGSIFCAEHVKSSVACLNMGRGGRSTRSYRTEGSWDLILGELKLKGYRSTYVLIQFGHNDQSDIAERWTDLATEFPANLRRFVNEVRAAGGIPVLVTPLARRAFKDGQLDNTLGPWAVATRQVAQEMKVPLADLNADSAALIQKMGPVDAMTFAMAPPLPSEIAAAKTGTTLPPRSAADARLPDVATASNGPRGQIVRKFDYTHLGSAGATTFARIVTYELAATVPELRSQLLP